MLPNTPSTISASDLYGSTPPGWGRMDKPAERDSAQASGDYSTDIEMARPAVWWAALVAMLIVVRLLWEKAS